MRYPRWTVSTAILAITFSYAILRYNIIKGVSWAHLPLFISNKAIALASVLFIAFSYLLGPLARFWPSRIVPYLALRRFLGLFGFGLGAVHGFMSLLLFSPANYPKLFAADGTLSGMGELSMLFGILSFLLFGAVASTSLPFVAVHIAEEQWQMIQRIGYAGLLLILAHVAIMGFQGWLRPSGWPGGLLPISMIAAAVITFTLLLRIVVLLSPGSYDQATRHPAKIAKRRV